MTDQTIEMAPPPGEHGSLYVTRDAAGAELALLKHLALEGELALRRDQLAAEHQAVTERLIRARQQRQALVQAVQDAGGKLPSWEA